MISFGISIRPIVDGFIVCVGERSLYNGDLPGAEHFFRTKEELDAGVANLAKQFVTKMLTTGPALSGADQ